MPKMPALSGKALIKVLERKGYTQARTKGSHVRLHPPEGRPDLKKTTVPLHKRMKPGTLSSIMSDAGLTRGDLQ